MKTPILRAVAIVAGLGFLALVLSPHPATSAEPEPDATPPPEGRAYAMDWWTADAGGGTSTGTTFSVTGTAGQHDTGLQLGGDTALAGGFWASTVDVLFADGFETGDPSGWSSSTTVTAR